MFQKREENKLSPKDKITPMDILLFVILVITMVMAFLALALEPDYYASDAPNDVTTTTETTNTPSAATQNATETPRPINVNRLVSAIFCVLAFLCIVSSILLHTILFCTCEKRAREMNISVIVLVWFGFLLFAISAAVSYRQIPNDGAWLMAAACVTVVSTLIAIFLYVEEQHIDRNQIL